MAIRGVNPSYFAGMPTVALDPNAHKPDPQYARMLSDAMQNRAHATDRRREFEKESEFKARDQSQQARRDRRSNEISKRNAAVNEASEKRYQSGQDFDQDRLKSADTRALIEASHRAKEGKDQVAYDFLNSELEKRGVNVRSKQQSAEDFEKQDSRIAPPAPPAAPPPAAPPVDRSPVGPRPGPPPPTASFAPAGEAEAAPPMRAAPVGVAPRATASFPPASGAPPPGPAPAQAPPAARPPASPTEGIPFINKTQDMSWIEGKQPPPPMPPRPMASDNAQFYQDMEWHPPTEKELLDRAIADVVAREAAGQTPTARPLLPGKTLRRRAAESDQMLSPDDPLLNRRTP